jgi:hypothetical protein
MIGNGHVVGINQIDWEPATNTLHVESDQQLKQDTTYLLVVTRGVHDASGHPIDGLDLKHGWKGDYGDDVERAMPWALGRGLGPVGIADVSVFTTQSITATSKQIRSQLHGGPVTFTLGTHGERTVFPLVDAHRHHGEPRGHHRADVRELGAAACGALHLSGLGRDDRVRLVRIARLRERGRGDPGGRHENRRAGGAVDQPSRLHAVRAGQARRPRAAWPTAIFGHGFTDSKDGAPWAVASSLAHAGIATIAINVVGHGGGALGTYTVSQGTRP